MESKDLESTPIRITVEEIEKKASAGDVEAQYYLGFYYFDKENCLDYEEAAKWLEKAAEAGHPEAQYLIGISYIYRYGVDRYYVVAVEWLRLSSQQGNDEALYFLGYSYYNGEGVERDVKEALRLWKESAERGNSDAWKMLSNCYKNGSGTDVDKDESIICKLTEVMLAKRIKDEEDWYHYCDTRIELDDPKYSQYIEIARERYEKAWETRKLNKLVYNKYKVVLY